MDKSIDRSLQWAIMWHPRDREILRLAIPAFGALVAEPIFLLTDSAIVGHLGTASLGALGVAGQALNTLVNLCVFLAYATTAGVARQVGAGNLKAAIRQGVDGIWLAAGLGVALIAIGLPVTPYLVRALGASPDIAPQAETYLHVSLFGVPGMLIVLAGIGVLRGLQDTRTPLYVSVAMFVVNGVLNALFVLVMHWGIAGSAWGTVIAQTGGAAVYVIAVARRGAPLRPDLRGLGASVVAGANLLIRTASLRVVLIVSTAVAARMGDAQIAAHQIAYNVWMFTTFALDAIAIAGQAITGRHLGAGDAEATRAATRRMIAWGIGCGLLFALLVFAVRPWLPGLFGADHTVSTELEAALIVVALLEPIAGYVYVVDGVLIGAGDMRFLALAGLVQTAIFLPAAWLVSTHGGGLVALWLAIGVWMIARLVTLGLRARGDAWLVTGAVRS